MFDIETLKAYLANVRIRRGDMVSLDMTDRQLDLRYGDELLSCLLPEGLSDKELQSFIAGLYIGVELAGLRLISKEHEDLNGRNYEMRAGARPKKDRKPHGPYGFRDRKDEQAYHKLLRFIRTRFTEGQVIESRKFNDIIIRDVPGIGYRGSERSYVKERVAARLRRDGVTTRDATGRHVIVVSVEAIDKLLR